MKCKLTDDDKCQPDFHAKIILLKRLVIEKQERIVSHEIKVIANI